MSGKKGSYNLMEVLHTIRTLKFIFCRCSNFMTYRFLSGKKFDFNFTIFGNFIDITIQ